MQEDGIVAGSKGVRFLEFAPDGMIVIDDSGLIVFANRQTEHMFGYSRSELLGKTVELLVPDRFKGKHHIHREEYSMEPRLRPMGMGLELFGRKKDGSEFPVEISLSPVETEKGRVVAAAIRDVSERKKAEAEIKKLNDQLGEALRRSERLAATGLIATSIAHEINNPLAALTNIFFLLGAGEVPLSERDLIESGKREVERITNIVKQTLSPHREAAAPVVIRATEIIDSVCDSFHRQIDKSRINVRREYSGEGIVKVFPGELRQVFANLVSNAIDAMSSGGELRLSVKDMDSQVKIEVSDTGHGIPSEKLAEIFEPFFTTKGEKGLGIGLWVSRNIIQKMGGDINVSSQAGEGTQFTLTLPSAPETLQ